MEDNWFCRYVKVKPPGGDTEMSFPCYRWLIGDVKVEIREGTGRKGFIFTQIRIILSLSNDGLLGGAGGG